MNFVRPGGQQLNRPRLSFTATPCSCMSNAENSSVDVPGTVVTVRVGTDDGGMTGEVVLAELQAEGLRPLHGQAVLYCVLRVEAHNVVMGLHVLPPAVLAVLAIGKQTGHSERGFAALKGVEQVRIPQLRFAVLILKLLSGERIVLVDQVRFDGGVVRVFRGDMLERCHTVHPELSRRAAGMRSGLQVR